MPFPLTIDILMYGRQAPQGLGEAKRNFSPVITEI
jgi:hypothetical protein